MLNPAKFANLIRRCARRDTLIDNLGADFIEHTAKRHLDVSETDVMQRILTDSTESGNASRFTSEKAMRSIVNEVSFARADDISEYIVECADAARRQPAPKAFTARFDGRMADHTETIEPQTVFSRNHQTGAIFESKTYEATLVLKAPDAASDFPIGGVTAYVRPQLSSNAAGHSLLTKRDLSGIVRQTPFYQSATPLHKAYLEQCCRHDHNIASRFDPVSNTLAIRLPDVPGNQNQVMTLRLIDHPSKPLTCQLNVDRYTVDQAGKAVSQKGSWEITPFSEQWDMLQNKYPEITQTLERIIDRADEVKKSPTSYITSIESELNLEQLLSPSMPTNNLSAFDKNAVAKELSTYSDALESDARTEPLSKLAKDKEPQPSRPTDKDIRALQEPR